MITKKCFVLFLLSGLSAFPALAQQQELKKAQEFFVQMEYEKVQAAASRVLENPLAQPHQVVEAYAIIGFSQSADGKKRQAEETFTRLLAIEPDYSPGDRYSPGLLGPFEKALKARNRQKLELRHIPPQAGSKEALLLEVTSNPFELAAAVRLRWKEASESDWKEKTKPLPATGVVEFTRPEISVSSEIEYQFQLLNAAGAAIKNLPDDEPFHLKPPESVAQKMAPSTVLAAPSVTDGLVEKKYDERETAVAPVWYRSWWFWTAVGAVVAGGVTAGVLLGTSSGSGAADYQIVFR